MHFLRKNYKNLRDYYSLLKKNSILLYRCKNKLVKPSVIEMNQKTGLDRCDIHFINLKHRKDRLTAICAEFEKLSITNFKRFDAIPNKNGALGCAKSHAKCLESAYVAQEQLLMICEDDCKFIIKRAEIDLIIEEFFYNPYLDVLCLSYNEKTRVSVSNNLMITSDTQTASCYLVKSNAIHILLKSACKSVRHLSWWGNKSWDGNHKFAIDQTWKDIQKKIFFCLPSIRAAKQRGSFSDIENIYVDYGL